MALPIKVNDLIHQRLDLPPHIQYNNVSKCFI